MLNQTSFTQSRLHRRTRGFTILEIMVVLAIIGMLVGLAVNNLGGIFNDSAEKTASIFVNESIKTSLVRYRIDNGDYPSTAQGLQALITNPGSDRWRGPYVDVKGGVMPEDPWKEAYQYRYPGTKNKGSYDVFSMGPDKQPDTADDIGNW